MIQRFWVTVLLLVASGSQAQAQGSSATDNELYAAYCKGAMEMLERDAAPVQLASRRFSAYLFATGVLNNPQRSSAAAQQRSDRRPSGYGAWSD